MTCIIGARTTGGHTLIAADTCISWDLPTGLVCRDELQKIYELAPGVVIALTTDNLIEARSTLIKLKKHLDLLVPKLVKQGRISNISMSLKRLFSYIWSGSKNYTGLLIGVVTNEASKLYFWDTRITSGAPKEILPGQYKLSGSVLKNPTIANALNDELSGVVHGSIRGKPLSSDQAAGLLINKLSNTFSGGPARAVGVGGLFQVAFLDGNQFVFADYESNALSKTIEYPNFRVELYYEVSQQKWIQKNLITGEERPLLAIDEHNFKRVSKNEFRY